MAIRWEDELALFAGDACPEFEVVHPIGLLGWDAGDKQKQVDADIYPIPRAGDRENFAPGNPVGYWLSGLAESSAILGDCPAKRILDIGGSTGRLARHFAIQHGVEATVADINYRHIRWLQKYLPVVRAMQITSIPHLSIPDVSFDLVTAYSVFTHIPALDQAWIWEIRRVLAPGGRAFLTFHSEKTHAAVDADHYLYSHVGYLQSWEHRTELRERQVHRYNHGGSYGAHVFLHSDYIRQAWGSIMEVVDIKFAGERVGQCSVVLRKS